MLLCRIMHDNGLVCLHRDLLAVGRGWHEGDVCEIGLHVWCMFFQALIVVLMEHLDGSFDLFL